MKNRKTMEALLLGALLVLAGCIEPTGGKSIVQPTAGLVAAEKDVVLKEAALVQPETRQVLGFDSSTGEITVAGDVAVKAGQVFHSGVTAMFPSGALKKVLAVKTLQESKKVLITEDAVLTDGIENGEYSAEGRLFLDGMRVESPDGSLTMVDSPETAALLGNGENSSLTRRFDVKYSIGNNVSVTGSFQLTLPFSFMLDIKSSELKAFDISIEPKLDLDLDIRGSLNDRHTHRLGTLYLQPVTIGVVVISPVLEVSLSTAIDGVTEFGFQAKSEFLAGARYSGTTGRWIPYSDNNIDVEIEPPSLAGAVEASLGLKKELRLYGVAGPYFTPEIYAGLRGKSDGSKVSFSAYRGLRARAEGEVKRLGKNLPDLNFTLFDVRDDLELSNKTNMLPIAGFSYTKEETSPGVYRVNFSDGSTDEDGSIVSREWDFDGDGNTDSTDRNPSRTFSNVDTAVVKLTVRDNRMGSKSISRRLIPLAAYTVSFDANGGSSVSGQSVPEGGRAAEPDAPTLSGYVFHGWYSDSDLTRPWDFGGDTVNSSLTLYAKWEEQEEIETLDESFEGGSLSPFWIGSWIIDSDARSGSGSLKSNDIDNSQSAAAEVRVRVSLASEISFYRKVSSEGGYDKLSFYINGNQPPEASWSGSEEWAEMSYPIEPGVHTLKWVYEKDDSYSDDSDCAWIDDVSMKRGTVDWLSPESNTATTDTTPVLSWADVGGAVRYEIQIAGSAAGLDTATIYSTSAENYTPAAALTNNKTHYWRVRAVDGDNQEGDWSTSHSLNVAIGAVSGLSPADGESTADTTPGLSWNAVPGAAGYEVQIAASEAGVANAQAVEAGGTSYTPTTALTNNTTHHWRVRAVDGGNQRGDWSTAHSLEVAIGTVSGLSPSSGIYTADTTPAFSWDAVADASGYEIQIADSPGEWTGAAAVPVTGTTTTYTPGTALTNNTTHYWRVRAVDGDNQKGAWSAMSSLNVMGTVSGLSPVNKAETADTTPTFRWYALDGADSYEIQIAGSQTGWTGAAAVSVTGTTTYTPGTVLTNNTTHYWRVRAVDGENQKGDWSEVSSLSVNWGAVSGLRPSDETSTTDTTPGLSWNAVDGAARYEIQIAGSEAGWNSAAAATVTGTTTYTPGTALTNNKTHYWRVRAVDGENQEGDWSTAHSLDVAIGAVSGLSPANSASTTDTTPGLSWNAVDGAARYEIQIADSPGGWTGAAAVSVTGTTTYTPGTALTNNTTHYWCVRAVDGDGQQGAWSTEHSLEVKWGTISWLSPGNGAGTADTTPALSWNAVPGAAGYEVQIADSEAGLASAQAVEVSAASYTPATALTNLQTHYWQVRAKDANGQYGPWSAIHSLEVNWGAIDGLSPGKGTSTADTTPTFRWHALGGADSYEIQIADSQNGLPGAEAVSVTGTATYTPGTVLTNNTTHYWRVRAVDGENQKGDWSEVSSLSVNWGAVSGLRPSDETSTTDTTPGLSWNAVDGAARYEIQIAGSEAGWNSAAAATVTGTTTYTPGTALTNNKTHYWRVRAVDGDNQKGAWSTVYSLNVMGTVGGLSPSSGTYTADTTPTFRWHALGGADSYEIQIADSQNGLPGAEAVSVTGTATYTPGTVLTNNTTHYWRVRAVDGENQKGDWSEVSSLSVNWGAVSGLRPSDETSTTDTTPGLSWNAVDGAARYEIQIAGSEAGWNSAAAATVTGTTTYTPGTALTNNKTHYWRVRAVDGDNQKGAWSTVYSLNVMGTVGGLSPSSGTYTADTTPTFRWHALGGADSYEIQIADSQNGLPGAEAVSVTGTATYTPGTVLTNNTTHYWRVRAVDGENQKGDWSEVSSLSVNWGAVSGLRPSDETSTTDTTPGLSWNAVDGAARYEIQIAGSEAGWNSAAAATVTGTTTYTPGTALTNNKTHYWRVRAVDGDNQKGAWSTVYSLNVMGTVGGLSPSSGTYTADTTPTFRWHALGGADSYEIQIADSQNGLPGAEAVSVTGTATYTPGTVLTNNTTHYWRVRAVDGENQKGDWSEVSSLSVNWGAVSGLRPSDETSTTDTTPGLSWNAVDGAARYEIQIAGSEAGWNSAAAATVTGTTTYTPGTALTNNKTHYWRVRAVDGDNQKGAWSTVYSLNVMGTVGGLSPSSGTYTADTTPTFRWHALGGADSYEIQIADSQNGLPGAEAVSVTGTATYTPGTVLTNNTTHYWRVRAVDGENQKGDWSEVSSLSVNWGAVSGLRPSDETSTTDTTPGLSWNAVDGAARYEIQIAGSEAGWNSAAAATVTGTTTYTPGTALTNNKTHYWRVRAVDGDNQKGAWSTVYSLNVMGTVGGLSPSSGTYTADTTPTFRWHALGGADSYEIQIADSQNGLPGAEAVSVTGTATYTPGTVLTNNTTHYWRVRAVDGENQKGDWSEVSSLSVNWGAVSGLRPSDETSTTDTTPGLSWNAVDGAARYEIQIAGSEAGWNSAAAATVTGTTTYTPGTALTNNKTHYWRVRAVDGDNQKGAWSTVYSLNVMGTVGGLSPSSGTYTADTTPTFRWHALGGADSYEIQIADSQNGLPGAEAVSVTGTATYTPGTVLTNNTTHYWRVRAVDGENQKGDWSEVSSLSVNWGAVSGLRPSDETSTTDTTPGLSWNAVDGAARYEIQIAGSEAGWNSAAAATVTGTTTYTPGTALTNNKTHYWRVRAVDGDNQKGAWSTVYSLNVMGTVGGLSPSSGTYTADTTPTFRWHALGGADSYEIQIADSQNGLPGAEAVSVTGTATYTPGTVLTNNTTHYWRVRAVDGENQKGDWSEVSSLSVNWGAVSGLRPSDETSTTDTTPGLSWNAVDGAARYEIQIAGSEAGWNSAAAATVTGTTTYTPGTALTNNKTHYWRVRAVDGDNQKGAWSTVYSLNVMGTVGGLSPSSGTYTADTTPTFRWHALGGADSYEIQIADSQNGLPGAEAVSVTGTATYTPGTVLTNNTTHYWRVRAVDGENQKGDWSEVSSLSVNWGAVSGLRPSDETSTTDTTPGLSWNAVDGAARYEIQIAGSEAGWNSAAAATVTGTTTYTPGTALTNNKTHYWRVRAVDGDNQKGAWSTVYSLNVMGTVGGLSPSSGTYTADTTPTFRWHALGGADSYEIQIADSQNGLPGAEAVSVTGTATYTPGTVLTNNTTHYWRVRAVDGENQKGDWSEVSSLSVNWGAVSGLRPSDETSTTDTTPALSWNAVPGAAGYEVQIAGSEAGLANAPAVEASAASYTPTTALTNLQTHYWRVRAKDGDGQHGAWSAINSLSVNWGTVSGLSPSSTTDTTPTFSWNAVPGAAGYEVQIAGSKGGLANAQAVEVSATSYTPKSALTNLQTHYWRVRALDSDDQAGSWSDAYSLMLTDGFVYVKGGRFQMGSTAGDSDEKPVHEVTVSPFYMSKYEVTQKEWREVMRSSPSNFTGNDNRPVEKVSWVEAVEYCNKLSSQNGLTPVYTINGTSVTADWGANGYRLPTEAEWEYAARGGNASGGYMYAGGNDIDEVAWYGDNSGNETHPVGQKAPNELGLYDMSGNVREWCWDWYGAYSSGSQSDPRGPASGSDRVNRGGSWYFSAWGSANRFSGGLGVSGSDLGFRLVRRGF